MQDERINLLPPERRRVLFREYLLRLAVVATALFTILVVVAGALLIPTYVFLSGSAESKKTRLASIESSLSSIDEESLSARLTALSQNAMTLIELADAPSASKMIRDILSIPRPGISVTGFSYSPKNEKTPATLLVSGNALTRDALRGYQLAVQDSSLVRSATLPVSVYAKDANLPFTISVTLAL